MFFRTRKNEPQVGNGSCVGPGFFRQGGGQGSEAQNFVCQRGGENFWAFFFLIQKFVRKRDYFSRLGADTLVPGVGKFWENGGGGTGQQHIGKRDPRGGAGCQNFSRENLPNWRPQDLFLSSPFLKREGIGGVPRGQGVSFAGGHPTKRGGGGRTPPRGFFAYGTGGGESLLAPTGGNVCSLFVGGGGFELAWNDWAGWAPITASGGVFRPGDSLGARVAGSFPWAGVANKRPAFQRGGTGIGGGPMNLGPSCQKGGCFPPGGILLFGAGKGVSVSFCCQRGAPGP